MIKLVDTPFQLQNQLGIQARGYKRAYVYEKKAAKTQQFYDDLLNPKYPNDNQNHKHADD